MRKGMSVDSLGSDEAEFVPKGWTPSPSSKQLTLGATLKRLGSEAQIIKVSSPGAKKQQSLKDLLVEKVCKVSSNFLMHLRIHNRNLIQDSIFGDSDAIFYDKC